MNVITITLNPAIDLQVSEEAIRSADPFSYPIISRESGGKGVNISRALKAFSKDSLCMIAVGEESADEYLSPLLSEGLNMVAERVMGATRVNLHANGENGDIVLAGRGACVDNTALFRIKERALEVVSDGDIVCLCGKLPPDCDKPYVIDMLLELKARGARIALDSTSFSLDDITEIYPYMIKPNLDELITLTESGNIGKSEVISIAGSLCGTVAENVLVTLGGDGAIYVSSDAAFEILAPKIEPKSTTGAGDSFIAGYIYALAEGRELADILRIAVAFGTAACLNDGTQPPKPCDVERLIEQISVVKMQ